ncbi:YqzL family protein [Shouchella clausii]|nr:MULTISPECIES: YqzL family protein [Shouchella]MCM3312452.1 YqzL family protein [Psychrobacillus sp. MER TA 17]ALA51151.1 hypothetical protein DB29_00323 [Shouchella clausii]MBU3231944.1 YqzL family protein [Shouchella clausii]MBU3264772.1 YqzL family protein [Shouchella clausii]MBU3507765.1 YqzL family protein [Shouchella clausii]
MLVLTWKVFSQTGNVETYLLHKELERDMEVQDETAYEPDDLSDSTLS